MFPLTRAYLCLDDDTVFEGGELVCPRCAGRYVVSIARWLNRPLVMTPREVVALAPDAPPPPLADREQTFKAMTE